MTTHPLDFDPDATATEPPAGRWSLAPIADILRESPGRCVCGRPTHRRGRCVTHYERWLALPYWSRL